MLKSHPDKKLADHLNGVKHWGEYFLKYSPNKLVEKHSDKELFECFLLLHDIGKATSYFQQYINGEVIEQELKSHAHLSSLIFLKYVKEKEKLENYEQTIKQMYMSIFKHHDELSTLKDCIQKALSEEQLMKQQWESIDKQELRDTFQEIGLDTFIVSYCFEELNEGIKEILMKWTREINREDRRVKDIDTDLLPFENYLLAQNLYSLLIDSDKSEVVLGSVHNIEKNNISIQVDKYLNEKKKEITKINEMRQEAFKEVENKLTQIKQEKIYTLTLPTGMGKTLNSLNFAFKLKEKLEKEEAITYKIIYALPFMSIIDQTVQTIERILEANEIACNTQFLLKSHHLAEIEWKENENTLESIQQSKILMEGWNSQIIVTTFIQLFETLIGYRNNSQRKYHQLNNSIVIIDEIQSLPVKYYQTIRNLLLEFTKYSNSKCIVMTATQPNIFKKEEVVSLCNSKKYYLDLERTMIFNEIQEEKTIAKLVEEFKYEEGKTYLMVLNTIKSTQILYDNLKEKLRYKKIILLNTNHPPIIRKKIIQEIKDKKYDIVISTQLIEAGVDIDLNVVYRDFCPLPSLMQSAGRAGREGKTKGKVHFVRLVNENQKEYATYIYDNVDLYLTKEVLKGKDRIAEGQFIELIEQYYEKIADPNIKSQSESEKLIKGLSLEKFSKRNSEENQLRYAEDFKLIEEKQNTINVFIELDEKAEQIWNEYENILKEDNENKWEQKAKVDNIRRKLAEYVVVVRLGKDSLLNNLPPVVNGYYYVEKQMLEFYYSQEYGFGRNDTIFI